MINRIGTLQTSRNFLSDLGRNQLDISRLQRELATGKRVSNPSDDPVGVAIALGLRDDLESVKTWKSNIADSQSWLSATDDAMGGFSDIVQRAQELAVQGANGALSTEARGVIATEVRALRDQVVEAGNASLGGRYLFGGARTDRPPLTLTPPGLAAPVSTEAMTRQVGQGQVMSVNVTADRMIDPAGATPDIFTTLDTLANAIQAGDSDTVSTVALAQLDIHLDNVNSLRGEVGAKMNRLELTLKRHETTDIARQQKMSDIEDTDIAQAVTELQTRQTVLQASMAVGARVMQRSLSDFLG